MLLMIGLIGLLLWPLRSCLSLERSTSLKAEGLRSGGS